MESGLSTLPEEIRTYIASFLSRSDLKNARTVSRMWDKTAQAVLFQTVFLRLHVQSFERLESIAHHENLRVYVRTISFDGGALYGGGTSSKTSWLQQSAARGLGIWGEQRPEFLAQFSPEQLQGYYEQYCNYIVGQKIVRKCDDYINRLLKVLHRFPCLSVFHYSAGHKHKMFRLPQLSSLSPLAQQILAGPEPRSGGHHGSEQHFWTFLQAACVSAPDRQLREIRGSQLDLIFWEHMGSRVFNFWGSLTALKRISLEFSPAFQPYEREKPTHLANMINRAVSLESLQLRFGGIRTPMIHSLFFLPQVFDDKMCWESLRRLSLQAVVSTEEYLRSLLQRHAKSLRFLELSDIKFEKATQTGEYGSWIQFIIFLNHVMLLEYVRFEGSFSNAWNEWWIVGDAGSYAGEDRRLHYPDDCLKFQIERFIIHDGPCPFIPKKLATNKESDNDHGLPWDFKPDLSWKLESGHWKFTI